MSVDDRFKLVRRHDDGRISYRQNLRAPAVVVTEDELDELSRLTGKCWVVPIAFFLFAAPLFGLWAKQPAIPVVFVVFAVVVSAGVIVTARQRLREILANAPRHIESGPLSVQPSTLEYVRELWFDDKMTMLCGIVLSGMVFFTYATVVIAKIVGHPDFVDKGGSSIKAAALAIVSGYVLRVHLKALRRGKKERN